MKSTITDRAFIARMKRHLAKDGLTLACPRVNTRAYISIGPVYTYNDRNVIEHQGVHYNTLVQWAREAGVLKPHEVVEGLEKY